MPIDVVKRVNGNLIVPRGAYAPGIMGDGYAEIGPDDPEYESWANRIERTGNYVQERKKTIIGLLNDAINKAKIAYDDEKVEALKNLINDTEKLRQYFGQEMAAIETQYQKDLVMAERAKRILEEKRAASKADTSKPAPPTNVSTAESEKPKKGKGRKGRGSGRKEGDHEN